MLSQIISILSPIVKRFEGLHKVVGNLVYPYLCPANKPTQGYGLLVKDMHVSPITKSEAEAQLDTRLPYYIKEAIRLSPTLAKESPQRIAAIADFVFNLGPTNYAASTLRKKVNTSDWYTAQKELRKWVYGGGRKLPGLIARRDFEAELLKS